MARRPRLGPAPAILLAVATLPVGCTGGTACPAALLTGDLVRDGEELVVVNSSGASAPAEHVRWPAGHRVENRDGRLVVVDLFGTVKAGEGDWIRLGGGETESGTWGVCGLLEADPMPS
jgi:hypothetical protein